MKCVLCADELAPVLADGEPWRLVLYRNQNLVGKCMLVTRRHVQAVDQLTAAERMHTGQGLGIYTGNLWLSVPFGMTTAGAAWAVVSASRDDLASRRMSRRGLDRQ